MTRIDRAKTAQPSVSHGSSPPFESCGTEPVPSSRNRAPCGSHSDTPSVISKFGWGGARANSGGARPGAGRKPAAAQQALQAPAIVQAPVPCTPRWYCVRTHYGAELAADIDIRLMGLPLFAPSLFKPSTPPRRASNGAMRPGKPDRIVPLFPRYLFVRFRRDADDWKPIRQLPSVEQIIGTTPELPTAISDQAIDLIRGMCAPNGCVYPANKGIQLNPLAVGTVARFLSGPMADLSGICTWSDGRRVQLLLEILGRPVSVTAAQTAVEAI